MRFSLDEQIKLMAQKMMLHFVGCCTIKNGTNVVQFDTPLPMLQMPNHGDWPWQLKPRISLGERKLSVYLDSLKSLPAYQPRQPFVCNQQTTTSESVME